MVVRAICPHSSFRIASLEAPAVPVLTRRPMLRPRLRPAAVLALLLAPGCAPAIREAATDVGPLAPTSAQQLVERMRGDWAGRWYESLEFRQLNTATTRSGEHASEWIERQRVPGLLRIDFVSPQPNGSGLLYRGDSVYTFDAGAQTGAARQPHPLRLLSADVYALPGEATIAALTEAGVDVAQFRVDQWQGQPAYVVGAPAGDSTSSQFWVDAERMLLVRLVWAQEAGGRTVVTDYHVTYQDVGGFAVPQEIVFLRGGRPYFRERYTDVRTNVPLDSALFDPAQWARGAPAR